MSYRKLDFNGKTYEYVIGSKFTKVKLDGKEFGVYDNKIYGNEVVTPKNENEVYPSGKFIVTPRTVTRMIRELPPEIFKTRSGKTNYLMVNPFLAEIYDKIEYIAYDYEDYYDLYEAI